MANKKSADKRMRQALKRRARNRAHRSHLRSEIKALRQVVASGDADKAKEMLPATLGTIDRTANKGGIHPNAADRTKSRLSRSVAAMGG